MEYKLSQVKINSRFRREYVPAARLGYLLENHELQLQLLQQATNSFVVDEEYLMLFTFHREVLANISSRISTLKDLNKRRTLLLEEIRIAPLSQNQKDKSVDNKVREAYQQFNENYIILTCRGKTYTFWVAYSLVSHIIPFVHYAGAGMVFPNESDIDNSIMNPWDPIEIGRKKLEKYIIKKYKRTYAIRDSFSD